ncbi:hypothetical protein S245_038213, partial [Arachis hypogaea]
RKRQKLFRFLFFPSWFEGSPLYPQKSLFSLVGVLILRLFLDLFGAVPPRQGFFFVEDIGFKYGLNVDPLKLQILPDSADLLMVGKPLYRL